MYWQRFYVGEIWITRRQLDRSFDTRRQETFGVEKLNGLHQGGHLGKSISEALSLTNRE
jgi:hypothetical protein